MGISNRDYYRESTGNYDWYGTTVTSVTRKLVILTVITYVLQILIVVKVPLWPQLEGLSPQQLREVALQTGTSLEGLQMSNYHYVPLLEEWGDLDVRKVQQGQVWRLLTYAFLHDRGELWHILFNMMALWTFGQTLESRWGKREFLTFYLISAIISGVVFVAMELLLRSSHSAIGASGAISALCMAFAYYYPDAPISIFVFTIPAKFLVAFYLIFDMFPLLQALSGTPSKFGQGVAHAAHLGGLAFGFVYCYWSLHLTTWLTPWLPSRTNPASRYRTPFRRGGFWIWLKRILQGQPKLKVHNPEGDEEPRSLSRLSRVELERRADEVLKKITEQGESSLTESEREVLREHSRRLRDRK